MQRAIKKVIPHVQRLGVITSATGAAIQDVLQVLARRAPNIEVIVYAAQVQGVQAPAQLIRAIERANQRQEVDTLLLTRGGGSLEDLYCFNDALSTCYFCKQATDYQCCRP